LPKSGKSARLPVFFPHVVGVGHVDGRRQLLRDVLNYIPAPPGRRCRRDRLPPRPCRAAGGRRRTIALAIYAQAGIRAEAGRFWWFCVAAGAQSRICGAFKRRGRRPGRYSSHPFRSFRASAMRPTSTICDFVARLPGRRRRNRRGRRGVTPDREAVVPARFAAQAARWARQAASRMLEARNCRRIDRRHPGTFTHPRGAALAAAGRATPSGLAHAPSWLRVAAPVGAPRRNAVGRAAATPGTAVERAQPAANGRRPRGWRGDAWAGVRFRRPATAAPPRVSKSLEQKPRPSSARKPCWRRGYAIVTARPTRESSRTRRMIRGPGEGRGPPRFARGAGECPRLKTVEALSSLVGF